MSKKRSWLCLIRRLFFSETHHQQQQKCKRRWLFGSLKSTKGLPSPATEAVPNPSIVEIAKSDIGERQNNRDKDVRELISKYEVEERKAADIVTNEASISLFNCQQENHVESLAATKIQTAYRGHLARKALRALKGFVTLQAIIRGWAVRRQAMTTLKCLQSIVNIQSEVCARRRQMSRGNYRDLPDFGHEKPKLQLSRGRRSDDELLCKDDQEVDIILRKKEAILRRQATKAYSFNHRNSADSEERNSEGRLRYWLQQYVKDQLPAKEGKPAGKQAKPRNVEGLNNSDVILLPRRSFHNHRKQSSYADEAIEQSSTTCSLPTYMAATKSAKAKTRSLSSPRLRPIHVDAYSDSDSPYKHKLSPLSSMNSEVTSSTFSKFSHKSCYSSIPQKSPTLKGLSGPIRSK